MEKLTASAREQRGSEPPVRKNMGTKNDEIASVETNAGWQSAPRHPESPAKSPCPWRITVDVLNLHGGVVHKMPTARAKPPSVMMLMSHQGAQNRQRREDGERNGDGDIFKGAAPASQEDQDHRRGQQGGDDRLPNHALDARAHEDRLVIQVVDLQIPRQAA